MSTLAQPDVPGGTVIDFLGSASTSQVRRLVCSQSIVNVPQNSPVDCADTVDEPARQASRHPTLHTPAFQQLDDITRSLLRGSRTWCWRGPGAFCARTAESTYRPAGRV